MNTSLVWFRNDLRMSDNAALQAAISMAGSQARAIVFITDKQWRSHAWGENKIGFYLRTALKLQQDLANSGIKLEFIEANTFSKIPKTIYEYMSTHNINELFFNHEYELNERNVGNSVIEYLKSHGMRVHAYHCQLMVEPGKLLTKQGTPYTVFTYFKKAWISYVQNAIKIGEITLTKESMQPSMRQLRVDSASSNKGMRAIKIVALDDYVSTKYKIILTSKIQQIWPVGEDVAQHLLRKFCANKISKYDEHRDIPGLDGTSSLSPHLAVGSLSGKQCLAAAIASNKLNFITGNLGVLCWINELAWREFYKHIVFHYPELCKGRNFNTKYDAIKWNSSASDLEKWQLGKTGFPIIDAAMRQLLNTGWMHNRLRMITAMFLSKNLLIDWREGEKYFSKHLIDLDFASNNGGWQWSASTGTDAAPYFRIFNPVTQSKRFDPSGEFIKRYCPELVELNSKQIHDPSSMLELDVLSKLKYPQAVVDLGLSRKQAIKAFNTHH